MAEKQGSFVERAHPRYAHEVSRRNHPNLMIEVRVKDDGTLINTYAALEWLLTRGYKDEVDWDVDMRGGVVGYSSFYFKDPNLTTEFKLVFSSYS